MKHFAVVDTKDKFILFIGSEDECEKVLDESYGGLMIMILADAERFIASSTSGTVES